MLLLSENPVSSLVLQFSSQNLLTSPSLTSRDLRHILVVSDGLMCRIKIWDSGLFKKRFYLFFNKSISIFSMPSTWVIWLSFSLSHTTDSPSSTCFRLASQWIAQLPASCWLQTRNNNGPDLKIHRLFILETSNTF